MALKQTYIPDRGDIVFLNFSPTKGSEQRGYRPAIVLSSFRYHQISGLCVALPITSKVKGFIFELVLPQNLKTEGVVLCDQVKSVDLRARKVKFLEKTPTGFCDEAVRMLNAIIK